MRFFEGVNEMAMVVIGWLMRLAPYGVFALIAATVARSGLGLLDQLLAFGAVVVVALLVHVVVVLVPVLRLGARPPRRRVFPRDVATRSSSRSRPRRRTRRFP